MKRLVSLFLSLVMIALLIPAAFAASAPPYSVQYLNNISGSRYAKYIDLDDITTKEYSRTQRTLEVYDVLELWLANGCSWSSTVEPFRQAFLNAGFKESISLDENNQNQYWYGKNSDVFIILGEKASQAILDESGIIYIEHNYLTATSTPASPTPTPEPTPTPSPVAPTPSTAQQAAQTLYEMGLFSGTGKDANGNPNFDLDRAPTRHEAVTMLVRLLGKENEAKNGTWNTPFTDVVEWAKPYVGYAYTNGLTSGTSSTTYGGNQIVTASQYLTFVLRALGYEVGKDFQWNKAWELSDKIGLTDGRYNSNTSTFTRGDVVIISNNALNITIKNTTTPLKATISQNLPKTNTITGEELQSLKTGCASCIVTYQVILKSIGDAKNATNINDYMNNARTAYDWIENFKVYLLQTYQACGDYDNTQVIKQSVKYIYDILNLLPPLESPNNFDMISDYMQTYLASMLGASEALETFKVECANLPPLE